MLPKSALRPHNKFSPSWNIYSLAIIIFVLICQIFRWPLFPFFIDIYYHLSVMLGFNQIGGYTTQAFWEFAPLGRPHLYPPLIHILMLDLYKIGFSKIFIARLLICLIYPLILISTWWVISEIFTQRLAFFSLVIFSSIYSFYLALSDILPFSLSLLLCLWVFFFVEKDKIITASLLLGLSFYTHTFMSSMAVLIFLFYGALNRNKLKNCLKVITLSLILSLPLSIHQFQNRQYFNFVDVMENYKLEINLAVYILALIGLIIAFRRRGAHYFFLALLLGMLPLAFTHKMRYLSGSGMISFIFLAALALSNLYERIMETNRKKLFKGILFIIFFFFLFHLLNPTFYMEGGVPKGLKIKLGFFDSSMIKTILPDFSNTTYATESSIYYPRYVDEVVKIIRENSTSDDIIYSNLNYAAGMFSVLSERATSTAMLAEVRPFKSFDPVSVSKLVVWVKEIDGKSSSQLPDLVKRYKLEKIAETSLVYIYNNSNTLGKKILVRHLVSLPIINLLLLMVTAAIIYDLCPKLFHNFS